MSDITIRNATLADAPRILEIYAYYIEHTVITFEYDVPSLAEFEDRMRAIMQKYPYLVIERDGRIEGYAYVKQLIDGNDVSVLLGVADEVVKVMDTLKFYIPTLKDMSMGLKLSLELIRRYLPEGAFSRIYLDEQPVDSGSYVAGAVALESGDLNTAGVAMFKIKPKTEGVRLYWAEDLPAGMTLAEAHNVGALLESDGVVVDNAKVICTYKKKGLFSSKSTEFPTQPGIYTQTATVSGNYSCEKITRTIIIS